MSKDDVRRFFDDLGKTPELRGAFERAADPMLPRAEMLSRIAAAAREAGYDFTPAEYEAVAEKLAGRPKPQKRLWKLFRS